MRKVRWAPGQDPDPRCGGSSIGLCPLDRSRNCGVPGAVGGALLSQPAAAAATGAVGPFATRGAIFHGMN